MTLSTLEQKLRPFEDPVSDPLSKWLYTHFPPRPITTRKMHSHYREAVQILMHTMGEDGCDRAMRLLIQDYLDSVLPFIEEYEKKEFPVAGASPEEVLTMLLEQNELSQYDIAREVGGQPVVSEILSGKRKLTRDHIERLSKRFHVSPATFYAAG